MIDTTGMSAAMLRGKIADEFLPRQAAGRLALTFMSFGFKHGPPREEDLAFDVRFLPNPHYEPELRELTGLDERVVEYIARDGRLEELYERLHALLDFLLPQYVAEGKAHLVVAIGCTGGRHRSVAIAEHLAERYRERRRSRRGRRAPRHRQAPARLLSVRARADAGGSLRADSLPRVTPGDGAVLPRPGIVHFRFRRQECPYAWGSTDSAGSAGTCSAPPRRGRDRRRADRVGRGQRPDRRADARAPAQVRLDPRALSGHRAGARRARSRSTGAS